MGKFALSTLFFWKKSINPTKPRASRKMLSGPDGVVCQRMEIEVMPRSRRKVRPNNVPKSNPCLILTRLFVLVTVIAVTRFSFSVRLAKHQRDLAYPLHIIS